VFGNLGAGEIVILLVIVLLVFGANRLPEAGRAVGKGLREFQKALRETKDEIERPESPPAVTPPRDATPKRLVE
jgi:sec-independent protein translocase protein TatA